MMIINFISSGNNLRNDRTRERSGQLLWSFSLDGGSIVFPQKKCYDSMYAKKSMIIIEYRREDTYEE